MCEIHESKGRKLDSILKSTMVHKTLVLKFFKTSKLIHKSNVELGFLVAVYEPDLLPPLGLQAPIVGATVRKVNETQNGEPLFQVHLHGRNLSFCRWNLR